MDRSQLFDRAGKRGILAYILIWGAAVAYLAVSGGDWTFPIASLLIFHFSLPTWKRPRWSQIVTTSLA